jgi:hypothetical protein
MTGELVSRLGDAARHRVPLVLVMADGTRHAGHVREVGITYAVLDCSDGRRRRVELADVVRALRVDGRRWYPTTPTREVRSWDR